MKAKNEAARELVRLRWAKTTAEERSEHARKMAKMPRKKRVLKINP